MEKEINITVPMPLVISIDDVGWWSGKDGSARNQPFRTGMQRDHVPEDYIALIDFGKGLDTKVLAGFVLCEWDKTDLLRQVPSTTWMGRQWTLPGSKRARKERAAQIIKEGHDHIEFGLHGVGHEFWIDGRMERTEFHDTAGKMRDPDVIRQHLDCFFKLMDQYDFNSAPKTFIPPALNHSFGNGDDGFQNILADFGIRYVTPVFNRTKLYSPPQAGTIAWENRVLLVERGESDMAWNAAACRPRFKFDRPVMALHWANILHPDPVKNPGVVKNWVNYIKEKSREKRILPARDTADCFTQYLHRILSKVKRSNEEFSVDVSWMKQFPGHLAGQTMFLSVEAPPGMQLKIAGARAQSATRSAETPFLKLDITKGTEKIWLRPSLTVSGGEAGSV